MGPLDFPAMDSRGDLPIYLERWAADDASRAPVARILLAFAGAAAKISELVRAPGCGLAPDATRGTATGVLREALADHAQLVFGDVAEAALSADGPALAAIVQPLANHDKLDFNGPLGTVLSLAPIVIGDRPAPDPRGRAQRAAAIVSYGARTTLALTVGEGTFMFDLDAAGRRFEAVAGPCAVAPKTARYAINTSYQRNWNTAINDYVDALLARNEGPMAEPVSVHWTNSLVLETLQVLTRGGVCMYPSEGPKNCKLGCVGRVEEANPIAWIVEQAGGQAINGVEPILDVEGEGDTARTPFIFGAREEVELVARYCRTPSALGTHSPLFGIRGIFRRF